MGLLDKFFHKPPVKKITKNAIAIGTATAMGATGALADANNIKQSQTLDDTPATKEKNEKQLSNAVKYYQEQGLISGKVPEAVNQAIQETAEKQRKQVAMQTKKDAKILSESFGQPTETTPDPKNPPAGYKYDKETDSYILKTGTDYRQEGKFVDDRGRQYHYGSGMKDRDKAALENIKFKTPNPNPENNDSNKSTDPTTQNIFDYFNTPDNNNSDFRTNTSPEIAHNAGPLEVGGSISWGNLDQHQKSSTEGNKEKNKTQDEEDGQKNKPEDKKPVQSPPPEDKKPSIPPETTLRYSENDTDHETPTPDTQIPEKKQPTEEPSPEKKFEQEQPSTNPEKLTPQEREKIEKQREWEERSGAIMVAEQEIPTNPEILQQLVKDALQKLSNLLQKLPDGLNKKNTATMLTLASTVLSLNNTANAATLDEINTNLHSDKSYSQKNSQNNRLEINTQNYINFLREQEATMFEREKNGQNLLTLEEYAKKRHLDLTQLKIAKAHHEYLIDHQHGRVKLGSKTNNPYQETFKGLKTSAIRPGARLYSPPTTPFSGDKLGSQFNDQQINPYDKDQRPNVFIGKGYMNNNNVDPSQIDADPSAEVEIGINPNQFK